MKTQAAIAQSANDPFTIEEVELADPGPGEVRVKMSACGICRSDLSALEGKETIEFPVVLGHEGAGVIEAVGVGVQSVREGDAVVLSWTPACGVCAACKRGEVHLCEGVNMTTHRSGPLRRGDEGLDRFMGLGAFCEHVVVPQAMAVPVESGLSPSHACDRLRSHYGLWRGGQHRGDTVGRNRRGIGVWGRGPCGDPRRPSSWCGANHCGGSDSRTA